MDRLNARPTARTLPRGLPPPAPPLRAAAGLALLRAVAPTAPTAHSAPVPPVIARTLLGTSSRDGFKPTSAPRCSASSSLLSSRSTAMILPAPASRAPCSTLKPIPPSPNTTTASPNCTMAELTTAPTPSSWRVPLPSSACLPHSRPSRESESPSRLALRIVGRSTDSIVIPASSASKQTTS